MKREATRCRESDEPIAHIFLELMQRIQGVKFRGSWFDAGPRTDHKTSTRNGGWFWEVAKNSTKQLRLVARPQRRRKQTRFVQSHFPVSFDSLVKARTKPPISAGEMLFSSTKMTPPCSRPSSAQALRSRGIVLRS